MGNLYRAATLITVTCLALAMLVLVFATTSHGAGTFLFIPGISGESSDSAHRPWIEVLSCDWGAVPPPRGAMVGDKGKRAGKLCFGQFTVLKLVDRASPDLLRACTGNQLIPEVRIALSTEQNSGYHLLVLKKVTVLSVRPGDSLGSEKETEIVTFDFKQVEYR